MSKKTHTTKPPYGRCATCGFAVRGGGVIECHARPPLPSREGGYAVWPKVRAAWVCAGYRHMSWVDVKKIDATTTRPNR